jgi:ubiquinol-cytochrome c reductase cytochrome b subunit
MLLLKLFSRFFKNHLIFYPTPSNLSYFWGFGSVLGLFLSIQIISGIFLSMHYCADPGYAFSSVEHIMRNVNFGWLFRYTHANGASLILFLLYCHMGRSVYYRSYAGARASLWLSGLLLFLLVMLTAFVGYVLP